MFRKSTVSFASVLVATLGVAAGFNAHAATPTRFLGDRVSSAEAIRTIEISPSTRYVNVDRGEIVKFVSGGKDFAFNFDSGLSRPFDLQQIAPQGTLDHHVMVYVNEGPTDPYVR